MAKVPRRGGVEWLEGPTDRELIVSFSETRPAEILFALSVRFAQKNGFVVDQATRVELWKSALEREEGFLAPIRARGVPKGLRDLFNAGRKKDVERLASELTLQSQDLMDLHYNCGQLRLSHHSKHMEFVPEQRRLTEDERAAVFAATDTPTSLDAKVAAKVRQGFVEREHRSIHMFANGADEWHCFFLSFHDTQQSDNHWKQGGGHLHFVNHTFDSRRLTKKKVWRQLDKRKHSLPTVHVRFREPDDLSTPASLILADGHTGRWVEILR
jgi:hypothetical protein